MTAFLRLVIFGVVVAAYSVASNYGIINLDDTCYVVERASSFSLKWAFTWVGDAMWTPLTWLSYWLDRTLFGEQWGCYHWHNILLHACSSVIFFEVLRRIFRPLGRVSLILVTGFTLLWAIHPLRVESVVWVAARKDCLSTLFFLLALWTWFGYRTRRGTVISLLLMTVGGMAKASVMIFPAFVLIIDWLVIGKRRHWCVYVVATLLAIAFAIEAQWAQDAGEACWSRDVIPVWYRLLNAFAAMTIYIGNFLNPTNLAFQCQIRYPDFPRFSLLGLCAFGIASYFIVATTYRSIKERRVPVGNYWSGVAIFLFSLAPFLGISPFGSHAFADRFTLLPTLGLSIAGCSMMMAFVSPLKSASKFVVCLSQFGVLAILAGITFRQCTYWENERTLFERTIQVDGPTNGNANDELVQYYYEFPHDYQKICRHGKDLMRSPDWQQLVSSTLGPILVEAAYEIGDTELANDFDSWQYREGPPSCVLPVRRFVGKEVAINFSLERRIGLGRPIGTNGRQPRNRTSSPNYRHNCTSCSTDKVEHARKTRLDIFIIHD